MKVMMTEEFCPPKEIQRMECELWNLRVKETNIPFYTTRFNELMILCPGMVPTKQKKVEAYIRGLSENIKGEVTVSEPTTLDKDARMVHTLMEQKVKAIAEREANNKKRKKIGHKARDCWSKVVATGANVQPIVTCYGCGEKGHIKTNCPARNNPRRNRSHGQAYALRDGNQNLGPNVVTEMKVMMTEEFCPPKEIQRMEGELWNLKVKEMNISSYTTHFNELVILCPGMVPTKQKKVEAYIRGLSENIKGEVTSSEPATQNKAVRMAHTLIEQKVKAIAEREADNKKRKWENIQGG
nr:hypothetical protein [Tanacetum cinerariifolium]